MVERELISIICTMMSTTRMQRTYVFLLLYSKILSNSGQRDPAEGAATTIVPAVASTSSIHRYPLLRGSNDVTNDGPVQTVPSRSTRRIEVDLAEDVDDDDDNVYYPDDDGSDTDDHDEEYTLDHEPQREFKQYKYVAKSNQKQLGGESVNVKQSLGDGNFRDSQNAIDSDDEQIDDNDVDNDVDNDGDDDDDDDDDNEEEEKDTDGNSGSGTGNDDLQENTLVAILRHEDPLPEREVVGDSIFLFPRASDNVFDSRQHDEG
jgi:hypothetical protein